METRDHGPMTLSSLRSDLIDKKGFLFLSPTWVLQGFEMEEKILLVRLEQEKALQLVR